MPPIPPTNQKKPATWVTIALVACIAVMFVLVLTSLSPSLAGGGDETVLREYFTDIDGDGDLDYVKEATVVLNCSGKACVVEPPTE